MLPESEDKLHRTTHWKNSCSYMIFWIVVFDLQAVVIWLLPRPF